MLRSLLRPRALVSHVLVLAVVAVCVVAGQWQLDRLDQRRESNARLGANLVADPRPVTELLAGDVDPVALQFRRVTATGTYVPAEEMVLENRELDGQSGRDVLTPLRLEDGSVLLVRRGWVPRTLGDPPVDGAAPPEGTVTVEGYLDPSVPEPTGFGPKNPTTRPMRVLQVPDLDQIAPQLDGELRPMMLRLTAQDPPQVASDAVPAGRDALPAVAEVAPLDEANHLSYAVQWHTFAVLALVVYGFWWRRRFQDDDHRDGDAPDRSDHPDGHASDRRGDDGPAAGAAHRPVDAQPPL